MLRQSLRDTAAGVAACALLLVVATCGWAYGAQDPPRTSANAITLNLDAAQSSLNWTLGSTLHTVHGTFAMKRGNLQFDPQSGSASGEFVADATSGKSGNDGRDKKMHHEILESARYSEVIFRPVHIEGKVAAQGACHVQLQGKILLHGSEHDIVVPVQAEISGGRWKGSAKFTVPYVQWGLKSPNTFLLKADPAVDIELELSGTLQSAAGQ
jgi:polyisoprenoid-binding protein YceI